MTKPPYKPQKQTIIGNIKKFMALPCDTPPSVWVVTGIEASLNLFYSIASPDPKEVYHQIRGNSLYHDIKHSLTDVERIPPPTESKATRFAFQALDFADLFAWDLFLADVAANGLINWTSQLIHQTQCPNKGYHGQGHGEFFFGAIGDSGKWASIDFSFPDGTDWAPVHYAGMVYGPRKYGLVAASANWELFDGTPCAAASRLSILETGQVLDNWFPFDYLDITGPKSVTFGISQPFAEGDVVTLVQEWSFNGGEVPEGEVFPKHDAHCFLGQYSQ